MDKAKAAQRGGDSPTEATAVDAQAVLRFVRQLSVKLKAGLPLDKCLAALITETRNGRVQKIVWEMRKAVTQGLPMSRVMRSHGGVFDECVIGLVEHGEQTHKLAPMLASVADYLEHRTKLRAALQRATTRPLNALSLVLLATFIATVVLSFLARETLPAAHAGQRVALSGTDQLAVSVSEAVRIAWPYVGVLGLFCFVLLKLIPRLAATREWIDRVALRLPLVGPAVLSASTAVFLRTIGLRMQAGTLMPEAMQIAALTAPSLAMRERIVSTIQSIEDNRPYIDALVGEGFLRLGEVTAVQAAERRGELGAVMLSFAADREREAAADAKRLTSVMDTVVVGLLGLAIISVVLTLYVPVFVAN